MEERLGSVLAELADEGDALLKVASGFELAMDGEHLARLVAWTISADYHVREVAGENSAHYQWLHDILTDGDATGPYIQWTHSGETRMLSMAVGAVKATLQDYNRTGLSNIRSLTRAEVFADFIEMAEHLLDEGYKDAAAVLLGGVLEESLRKFADALGLSRVRDDGRPKTIGPLNDEILKANHYDKLVHREVSAWATLRNQAAHGQYSAYDENQVQGMLLFVRRFAEMAGP